MYISVRRLLNSGCESMNSGYECISDGGKMVLNAGYEGMRV